MLKALNQLAAAELRFPKVGTLHPCSICGRPDSFRFLGVRLGKGRWETLDFHTMAKCVQQRRNMKAKWRIRYDWDFASWIVCRGSVILPDYYPSREAAEAAAKEANSLQAQ